MNREKIKQLRDHIAALPKELFTYSVYLRPPSGGEEECEAHLCGVADTKYPCGTAGCVAGHCVMLFDIQLPHLSVGTPQGGLNLELFRVVRETLGLPAPDAHTLCITLHALANQAAAVRRLDHLLEHGTLRHYDFHGEPEACGYAVVDTHTTRYAAEDRNAHYRSFDQSLQL
jgi:hypothetical protein